MQTDKFTAVLCVVDRKTDSLADRQTMYDTCLDYGSGLAIGQKDRLMGRLLLVYTDRLSDVLIGTMVGGVKDVTR